MTAIWMSNNLHRARSRCSRLVKTAQATVGPFSVLGDAVNDPDSVFNLDHLETVVSVSNSRIEPLLAEIQELAPSLPAGSVAPCDGYGDRSTTLLLARYSVLFSGMRTASTESIAGAVRHQVEQARPGTFFRRRDFEGSDRAVESALSRLAGEGELIRVRRGLYWRGKATRFGMTRPSTLETAVAVGGPGTGPAGVAAAQFLGLTTQVPATVEVAVPGKVPEPMKGLHFRSRPYSRRERRLTPAEIAVLEVLRDPDAAEVPWYRVVERIRELLAEGALRAEVLGAEASAEPRVMARERWAAVAS